MDIRVGSGDSDGTPWSVLSDLAITIVLVLVLFITLQFIQTFRERAINTELARRQTAVRLLLGAVADSSRIKVDSLAPDRQRLTFREEVLFETCRAELKPEGRNLLFIVGRVLGAEQRLFESVHVEGHTDRVPTGLGCPFASNWALSSARATSVVSLLSSLNLLANPLLSAIGRAEFHPVDPAMLAPNRRIELILQYDRSQIASQLNLGRTDDRGR
jgi:flagellar motor protein MotB